jgi:hypothetical protein
MGGERRRRRLRRGGRGPGGEPPAESIPDGGPHPDDEPASTAADPDLEAAADLLAPDAGPRTVDATRRAGSQRGRGPRPGAFGTQHRPSPADLAELAGPFALTAGVHDPEPAGDQHVPHSTQHAAQHAAQHSAQHGDDPTGERGLRGLVGGGSSQVNVAAAMRARDASRPSDEHVAAAEADLPIVRRGWVPRDELPRPGAH